MFPTIAIYSNAAPSRVAFNKFVRVQYHVGFEMTPQVGVYELHQDAALARDIGPPIRILWVWDSFRRAMAEFSPVDADINVLVDIKREFEADGYTLAVIVDDISRWEFFSTFRRLRIPAKCVFVEDMMPAICRYPWLVQSVLILLSAKRVPRLGSRWGRIPTELMVLLVDFIYLVKLS